VNEQIIKGGDFEIIGNRLINKYGNVLEIAI
jgi:hypothetical protein